MLYTLHSTNTSIATTGDFSEIRLNLPMNDAETLIESENILVD